MKHQALEALLKLREYALEKEQQTVGKRAKEENQKLEECGRSHADLQLSYQHTVGEAKTFDYLRRDKCVREAGGRHINNLRQLALVQQAKQAQIEVTLGAKKRADMIQRVIDNRLQEERLVEEAKERKQVDDISQTLFSFHKGNGV